MPGRRLGLEEWEEIRVGLVRGESLRVIARRLGRPVSTIARAVDRNGGWIRYVAACAQRRAKRCARRPKPPRLVEDAALARRVTRRLVEDQESPMTIARAKDVSHETIYQASYPGDRGLDPGLWRHLHHQRRPRWR
ncbi:helix-turn-helix domain-containing protein [Acidimicrobium ferrooxidans]|uniref:helix-turn-helix domain-containing protein n=1 Tax=Acidimicrobium ferrooxidans TaxID=53635 RepID=UPI00019DDE61